MAFGVLLLVWASIRVLLMRKSIEQSRVKDIKGLMMCTCASFTFGHSVCLLMRLALSRSPYDEDDEHAVQALMSAHSCLSHMHTIDSTK